MTPKLELELELKHGDGPIDITVAMAHRGGAHCTIALPPLLHYHTALRLAMPR